MNGAQILQAILDSRSGPFALLHRPDTRGTDQLEVLRLDAKPIARLDEIPLSTDDAYRMAMPRHDALVLVPHHQVAERGFEAKPDDCPLMALPVLEQGELPLTDALDRLPNADIAFSDAGFDIDDEAYAEVVHTVLAEEIGRGEGSNFVIKRSFVADIAHDATTAALTLFRRLMSCETGAYWTFVVHTGTRILVGATPERHVTLHDAVATMNPISGTYRYPASGAELDGVLEFLLDQKETDELYMVLDEELKMMSRVCPEGARVIGPYLREMASLAHTEYYIEGKTTYDPRKILRETLLAPTVTGSPLENACRVIARHERHGRGYYGGVAALIGRQADGRRCMDSAILIRTADVTPAGTDERAHLKIGVGATLVRHSDASSEVAETHAKIAGVLKALSGSAVGAGARRAPNIARHPAIEAALERRNDAIGGFWLKDAQSRRTPHPELHGQRALIVDAEDTFTAMLADQLGAIGLDVEVARFDAHFTLDDRDLVVMGPGPGDPREIDHPRISQMYSIIDRLIARKKPFLAVCLSHQLLCRRLGLHLRRRDVPNQGVQRQVDLFGMSRRVGFYNSFAAFHGADRYLCPDAGMVLVGRDKGTDEVHALKGSHFASVQFHIESVLTQDGESIFADLLLPLVTSQELLSA